MLDFSKREPQMKFIIIVFVYFYRVLSLQALNS